MLGFDPEIGTSALRLWVAAGSAALLLVSCLLALSRSQSGIGSSPAFRAGFVIVGAVLGAAMTWAFLDRAAMVDRSAERRALELRAQELSARALAPGSPLACLDAVAGENVAAACERALFVSPASVAAASSYVAERLALLAAMVSYVGRGGADIEDVLLPLRRSLEADPFGLLAHVLSIRDGCTNNRCKALALLHDASRVRANLSAETLDHYLGHYLALWAKAPDGALADAAPAQTAAIPQGARKVGANVDSRAHRAGPAGRDGRCRCQSEPAARHRTVVATLAKAGCQYRSTNSRSTVSFGGNRTDLAGARPITSASRRGAWRGRALPAQSCSAPIQLKPRHERALAMS
jgi:hypothetical protein